MSTQDRGERWRVTSVLPGELRAAARGLIGSPAFTLSTILILGLGLGAAATAFGFISRSLTPFDLARADRLVRVARVEDREPLGWTPIEEETVSEAIGTRMATVGSFAGFRATPVAATSRGRTRTLRAELVLGSYFDALGIQPLAGRLLQASDSDPSAPDAVAIGESLWRSWLNGSPSALGQTLTVAGRPYSIVGIVPASFAGVAGGSVIRADVWLPKRPANARDVRTMVLFGRLKNGVGFRQADAEFRTRHPLVPGAVNRSNARLILERGLFPRLPAAAYIVGGAAVLGLTGVVLAIVGASLANLLLARVASRRAHVVIRLALGARSVDILRLLAIDVILICMAGGLLGLWVAFMLPRVFPEPFALDPSLQLQVVTTPDWRVFVYALALTGLVGLILVRVLSSHISNLDAISAGSATSGAGGATPAGTRTRSRLLASQVTCSTLLLVFAGFLTRTALVQPSFDAGVASPDTAIGWIDHRSQDHDDATGRRVSLEILDAVRAVPGVQHAAVADGLPNTRSGAVPVMSDGMLRELVTVRRATAGFVSALNLPIVRGRLFFADEARAGARVVAISESTATTLWPHADPIGRTLRFALPPDPSNRGVLVGYGESYRVVGIIADAPAHDSLTRRAVVAPLDAPLQSPATRHALIVRAGSPALAVQALRTAAGRVHPEVAFEVRTLREELGVRFELARSLARLLARVGAFGVLIASVGLYGLAAYLAEQRRRELSIRRALGATNARLRAAMAYEMGHTLLLGVAPGVLGAVAAGYLCRSYFWMLNLKPLDWPVLLGIPIGVLLLGLLISLVPYQLALRRASFVDLRNL